MKPRARRARDGAAMHKALLDTPEAAALREGGFSRRAGLFRGVFLVSGLCLALLNSFNSLSGLAVTVLPKLALLILACFPLRMLPYAFARANWKNGLIAAGLSLSFLFQLVRRYAGDCAYALPPGAILPGYIALAALAFPALLAYALCGVGYAAATLEKPARAFLSRVDRVEKRYLLIFCGLLSVATVLLFTRTGMFYGGGRDGVAELYDVIYTCDSGALVQDNAYLRFDHMENDLRQPLFSLFAMPFALPVYLVSRLFFFVPNLYAILLNLVQVALIGLSALLLARMMELEGGAKIGFLTLFSLLYPTLLFSLAMEQYVFAVFYLLCFLYLAVTEGAGGDAPYIAMTGSLLTSGVWFPLIAGRVPLRDWLRRLLRCALLFAAVVLVYNRQHLFLQVLAQADYFAGLAGGQPVPFADKLLQYLNMLACCFVRPAAGVTFAPFGFPSWQMLPVTNVSLLGLIVLLLAALGFGLNVKRPFARICGAWALVSYALHGLVGWGAGENGMILYTHYYGWAFLCLMIMGCERLLRPLGRWRLILYGLCAAALAALNLPAMAELIGFGFLYYPM